YLFLPDLPGAEPARFRIRRREPLGVRNDTVARYERRAALRAAEATPEGRSAARRRQSGGEPEQADRVSFGVAEEPDHHPFHDLLRTHEAGPSELLRPEQRGLDVGHPDIERHVAFVAGRRLADPAA